MYGLCYVVLLWNTVVYFVDACLIRFVYGLMLRFGYLLCYMGSDVFWFARLFVSYLLVCLFGCLVVVWFWMGMGFVDVLWFVGL